MRITAYLLIIVGILIMLYPMLNDLYSAYYQKNLLNSYENHEANKELDQAAKSYRELDRLFGKEGQEMNIHEPSTTAQGEEATSSSSTEGVLGTMEINKINLHLPILAGASERNLKYAAGHLEGTSPLGAEGNTAIAAHRSYTYGKLFNRLDELEFGDEVVITTNESVYKYQVHQKLLVDPSDITVLHLPKDKAILTLITCHPMKNPTHRLIIQAQIES